MPGIRPASGRGRAAVTADVHSGMPVGIGEYIGGAMLIDGAIDEKCEAELGRATGDLAALAPEPFLGGIEITTGRFQGLLAEKHAHLGRLAQFVNCATVTIMYPLLSNSATFRMTNRLKNAVRARNSWTHNPRLYQLIYLQHNRGEDRDRTCKQLLRATGD